jgi:tetratricopeptide (TPR) repeat protein
MNIRSSWFAAFGVMLLLSLMWIWRNPTNTASLVLKRTPTQVSLDATHSVASVDEQIRDVDGDYALGVEDYPDAIRLHREVVRQSPRNALAHYHLGFALGMMGERETEVREYRRSAALGLRTWDLFLNLGLAQADNGDLRTATDSLRRAVLLGEDHSESHFNLALVYERRGMLADAERETLASLRLNPKQPERAQPAGCVVRVSPATPSRTNSDFQPATLTRSPSSCGDAWHLAQIVFYFRASSSLIPSRNFFAPNRQELGQDLFLPKTLSGVSRTPECGSPPENLDPNIETMEPTHDWNHI